MFYLNFGHPPRTVQYRTKYGVSNLITHRKPNRDLDFGYLCFIGCTHVKITVIMCVLVACTPIYVGMYAFIRAFFHRFSLLKNLSVRVFVVVVV